MIENLLKPWKNWLFVNLFGGSLLINVFLWIWLNLKISGTEVNEIVLHYSIEFGVDIWGEPVKLFLLPMLGLAILVINILLAFSIWSSARVLALILMAVALICQIILGAVSFLVLTT